MTTHDDDLLALALRDPARAAAWRGAQWTEVFRQARYSGLAGRLAEALLRNPDQPAPLGPPALRNHLEASLRVCAAQHAEVLREARHLDHALASLGAPVVLLKGAAYAVAGLPAAQGRIFSDIDILVPKASLARAESLLTLHGWMTTEPSEYNQQYYRRWMHELPPMRHIQRGTVLDVHHNILPDTARLKPDASKLILDATKLPGTKVLYVLCKVDMLLHSMTHLFMNDDMTQGLRDLSDLALLLQDHDESDALWSKLSPRAQALDLGRPLYYGLQQLSRVMHVDVPQQAMEQAAAQGPGPAVGRAMDWIWSQALAAPAAPRTQLGREVALSALYLRGHWLRMPPLMLFRHLSIKAMGLHKSSRKGGESPDPLRG